jgi:uncharacterized protein (DUF1684 family)
MKLSLLSVVVVATLAGATACARLDAYEEEVAKWRAEREASLKADDGWLTVAGLYFLKPGANHFGTDPANDIVLPAGAPARAGVFRFADDRVTVEIFDGVGATLAGQPVRAAELRPAGDGRPADAVVLGDLTMFVHRSGDRYAIRLRDQKSEIRRTFRGRRWYPVRAEYRIAGRFEPYDAPRERHVPNILGDAERYVASGLVAFELNGQEYRLEAFESSGPSGRRLFFVFRDATSGKDTYGAARFLYSDPPEGGRVVLDFNKAYNPPCAFNPYTTCPLPPPQNVLPARIEAGELDYGPHASKSP